MFRGCTNTTGCVRLSIILTIVTSIPQGLNCLAVDHNGPKVIVSRKTDGHSASSYHYFDDCSFDKKTSCIIKKIEPTRRRLSSRKLMRKLKSAIRTTFLPSGFPQLTPQGYLSFSLWSWIQDLSTQLRAVLATQRVLEGVGVGREGASVLSASLNFIVRDGCGMASTLLFTALSSAKFKTDVKKWRILADVMNDIGITLEVTATLVPQHLFLPMICVGNMCKAICGVAAGACNGAINLHWTSKGSDISDINAKFGAQHSVTASLGLIFAALFARSVSSVSSTVLWPMYILLTLLHVFANLRCLRLVAFDYLNTHRMDLIVNDFLSAAERLGDDVNDEKSTKEINVMKPMSISKRESLIFGEALVRRTRYRELPIRMGSSFDKVEGANEAPLVSFCLDQLSREHYFVLYGSKEIVVGLSPEATNEMKAKAYFHACMVRKAVKRGEVSAGVSLQTHSDVSLQVEEVWPVFIVNAARAGWDLRKTELSTDGFCVMVQHK